MTIEIPPASDDTVSLQVHLTDPSGQAHALSVPAGWTLMEAAVNSGVEGIVAACGGACACATCHVYVDPAWMDRLPPIESMEDDMLACVDERRPNSRLSCQIRLTVRMNGLAAEVPENNV